MARQGMYVCIFGFILGFLSTLEAQQTRIEYTTTDLGDGRWEYEYNVFNISLTEKIEEFTIWFDYGLYQNLSIETADPPASNWDELLLQPEPVLEDDGAYDALAWTVPIDQGLHVSGFIIRFDWLGTAEPASQFYEIIDPDTFAAIDSGYTVFIPEPVTMLYVSFGIGIAMRKKVKRMSSRRSEL